MCGRTWTLSVRPVWEETCACAVRRSGGSAEPPGLVLKTKLYLLLGRRRGLRSAMAESSRGNVDLKLHQRRRDAGERVDSCQRFYLFLLYSIQR